MTLITAIAPGTWRDLEDTVADILRECGMDVQQQINVPLPRGSVDLDVFAEETVEGIRSRVVCECKNWRTNVPREKVHAFRTVMDETGANRGYIISRTGFQQGAVEAAASTNVELLTFEQFQERYFDKWITRRCRDIEDVNGNFNVYYEPLGRPGYHALQNDDERAAYDQVWERYAFAGVLLLHFSPYLRMVGRPPPLPPLPVDVRELERQGLVVPHEVKAARGYRELLQLLEHYGRIGLEELRGVNPLTRGQPAAAIVEELDAPMSPQRSR
ncbi:restriction endonuclease [Bradyrhizobium liaoningense]|uniref:restriction endonuclease n=1 Tax=Bradyrhizobium liaoningense TaxID=43992 RepID=UPI001BAE3208|nr:restriction endonuclease [Bradyrhizobium liaoningense]MBR0986089.1 restriction endonuclease [Bradyrhizobium liaoningense]